MKPEIIQIAGANDHERTAHLKAALSSRGHSSDHYEWYNGEPLYFGEPTYAFFEREGIYFTDAARNAGEVDTAMGCSR